MSSDAAKLVHAARKGDDAKVKRLLKAKADVDEFAPVEGVNGYRLCTALTAACANANVGAARLLLKAKAKVDHQNGAEEAGEAGRPHRHGADPPVHDVRGEGRREGRRSNERAWCV